MWEMLEDSIVMSLYGMWVDNRVDLRASALARRYGQHDL